MNCVFPHDVTGFAFDRAWNITPINLPLYPLFIGLDIQAVLPALPVMKWRSKKGQSAPCSRNDVWLACGCCRYLSFQTYYIGAGYICLGKAHQSFISDKLWVRGPECLTVMKISVTRLELTKRQWRLFPGWYVPCQEYPVARQARGLGQC